MHISIDKGRPGMEGMEMYWLAFIDFGSRVHAHTPYTGLIYEPRLLYALARVCVIEKSLRVCLHARAHT
jgi:hypothetical protein